MAGSPMHLCLVLLVLAFASSSDAVVNGSIARAGHFPFIVSLQWNGTHKCGGTLINHDTVLTVAHCIPLIYKDPSQPGLATALLGARNQLQPEAGSLRVSIARYIVHPQMPSNLTWEFISSLDLTAMAYDYALMKLARRVQPSRQIQFARLAPPNMPRVDTECTILGWGRFALPDTNSSLAELFSIKLRYGRMRVAPNTDVLISASTMLEMSSIFRLGRYQGMLCFGDSGSPVACKDALSSQWYVGGLAEAAVLPCNYPNINAVVMRVDNIGPWIARYCGSNVPAPNAGGRITPR